MRTILALILLLLLLGFALSLPAVQTRLGRYMTEVLREDYGADIRVERVAVSIFGSVKLSNVHIRDHHQKTLIFSRKLQTSILSFKRLYDGDLLFGEIQADELQLYMRIYKGETDSNLDRFIALFDDGKPSSGKFLMQSSHIAVTNGRFVLSDYNLAKPIQLRLYRLNAGLDGFQIKGPDVTASIQRMSFIDERGLRVRQLTGDFTYTKTNILLQEMDLETDKSSFYGDVALRYDRKDFADFNNKVRFDVKIDSSMLASDDIRLFYDQLGKGRYFSLRTRAEGTLNNFIAKNLRLVDDRGTQINGNINFRNLFGKNEQQFYMNGNFSRLSSSYRELTGLLPEILGKSLPSSLDKLGTFNLRGKAEVTTQYLNADFYMTTALGNVQSRLSIDDIQNIDSAAYEGNIILEQFNIGRFLNEPDLGTVTLNVDVDGRGFTAQHLNTNFAGDVYRIKYRGYEYRNVVLDGHFKKPLFKGKVVINDPNLFMDFDGLVNVDKRDTQYDFRARIDYADLYKLRFVADTISVFKGDIRMQVAGTSLDDMAGTVNFAQTSFQNSKDLYLFDDFTVTSSFDQDRVRTITINSPDIIKGKIVGKYEFAQVRKMVENSLGSLYANYSPNPVRNGQFMRFNFSVYNKIIEIFAPRVSVSRNTEVSGHIDSDENDFEFSFKSPQISAYDNVLDSVRVTIDNKNPLFNAYVSVDSIKTPYYKFADFQLLNVTANDTMNIRSEFKGGPKGEDYYNIDLYHTIDPSRKSVVGFKKSELKFKDYLWYINEAGSGDNRVVFDKKLRDFTIDNIVMSHLGEQMELNGTLSGRSKKDLRLTFDDIALDKITPEIRNFLLGGRLNGVVNFRQEGDVFQPTSSLTIDSLKVNEFDMGRLGINIEGDETFRNFRVRSLIEKDGVESFNASGDISIENGETFADIDLRFDRFHLGMLSAIGGEVITNVDGYASGAVRIDGNIKSPDINGRLLLDDAGLTIPYLNVAYQLERKAIVDVTHDSFIIRNSQMSDTKFNTTGFLNGRIRHKNFTQWALDLNVNSQRLLVLDTQDSEEAVYYGTAFMDGTATIAGPTEALVINVNARSEKGTSIKIPINDATYESTSSYIHFVTVKEKYNRDQDATLPQRDYGGLELKFDFDIDEDAEIEVILDRNSGHGMKGRGRGSLAFRINTQGTFNMWGDYQIYEGEYNFKYGGLIDKKLQVKKFSSIVWEGDPLRAQLNIEAIYKTTANPGVLLENASFNRKVPVEVVVGIRGNLLTPEPDFNINFPTVSSVLKSEIQYKLDDKDVRQTQSLYLLSSGGFLSPQGVNQADLAGNLFERASGLFNDLFQDEEGKVQVGVDYVGADRRAGIETDGRFGVTISTKVNERITVNGKVGVPVGGVNESTIVGDVEILYRVNEDGTMNLRVFNRENDINYIGQGIGYTQGVGLTYEVDFDTFKEFVKRVFGTKLRIERARDLDSEFLPDSDIMPDYIQMDNEEVHPVQPIPADQPPSYDPGVPVNDEARPHEE